MRISLFWPRLLAESTWKAADNEPDADGLLSCAVCDIIERLHSIRSQSAMSQGGHLVKPTGSRRSWAIMYHDTEGKTPVGGEIQNQEQCANASKRSLERDRQRYLLAALVP